MLTKSNNSFHFFFFFLIKTVLIKLLYAKIAQRRQNVQRTKKIAEGTNEQRKGITRWESPSPRSVKQRTTKRSKQLVSRTFHILKPLLSFQLKNLILKEKA